MILKERVIDASALGGAALLVVGAWWMAGQINGTATPIAAPRSTVTVTAPATTSAVSAPPGSTSTGQTRVEAVAAPGGASGGSAERPGTISPSGPSPAPRPPASGTSSGGMRAAVRLSHPLGVLPDADLALTIGGTR